MPSKLTVLNNHDGGAGSLRDTIGRAHDGDTIVFAAGLAGQTITLTSDELAIKKSLDIEGPGADKLAVSGNDTYRVFDVVNQGLTVTIAGLTITHGHGGGGGAGSGGGGGAILNASSTLNVVNDVVSNNQADTRGGGITNQNGVLTVTNTVFIGNQAIGGPKSAFTEGGAIWNSNRNSSATVVGCTFIGNRAIGADDVVITGNSEGSVEANGGAIHSEGFTGQPSTLVVRNSTFIGNEAVGGNRGVGGHGTSHYIIDSATGGGIANDDGSILVIDGCVFSSNRAIGGSNATGFTSNSRIGHAIGGAVQNDGTAMVSNSVFDHNEALGGWNNTGGGAFLLGRGAGGAIGNLNFTSQGALTVSNCTFTSNRAVGGTDNTGGPFANQGAGGAIINERGSFASITGSTFSGNKAIGGQGGAGLNGADGLGGGLANLFGATLTASDCTLSGNQAIGGVGGPGANGGNGFGGGLFNDGLSIWPTNVGTPATLTVTGSTITGNSATGGLASGGGTAGLGEGGGACSAAGGAVCLDASTLADIFGNTATTDSDDVFGVFTIC
ncbi:MAG: hypothetical protein ACJ8F7_09560 [Gemmataceae bacterium]